jgi:PncC family amidohydrolase
MGNHAGRFIGGGVYDGHRVDVQVDSAERFLTVAVKHRTVDAGIGKLLLRKGLTLSVCESCTGGMLASSITGIPGSSRYFIGGIIAYSDDIKRMVVGVRAATLKRFGAVSKEVAQEMARGARYLMASDLCIAITGIAGPGGGTVQKPVGLVYIAVAVKKRVTVRRFFFKGGRHKIRKAAVNEALNLLNKTVQEI